VEAPDDLYAAFMLSAPFDMEPLRAFVIPGLHIQGGVMVDLLYGALALGLFALFGAFVAALRRV